MLEHAASEKLNAARPALATYTAYLFFAALLLNFFCILSYTSNTLALILLALCYPLALLAAGERPRLTWYHALFALFIGYLILHKILFFPEAKIFAFNRKAVLAFLAGMAAFQLLKDRNMRFMYLMNLVLPFVIAGVALLAAFGHIPYESLFNSDIRLRLPTNHPNFLGMMLCICVVTGLSFLFRKDSSGVLKPFVLFGTLLCLGLLIFTLSKAAFFSTAIVGGLFFAYMAYKRWDLLRSAALCILLALCAGAVLHLAPMEQQRKNHLHREILDNALTPWKYTTFTSRLPIWGSSILAVKENPLVGIGPNNFGDFHQERARRDYDRLIALYGQDIVDGDTMTISTAHNVYLRWFAETGISGGLLFCLLFFTPLAYCLRKRTLCGEMGLILAAYGIGFFFSTHLSGGMSGSFGVTVTFMTLGYFSGILGQGDHQGRTKIK